METFLTLKPRPSKFTKNERAVLSALLTDCRTPDIKIAEKLRITTQAVGKIRRKLESMGVIKSYCARLDFEKVGINIFCMTMVRAESKFWNKEFNHFRESLLKSPYVMDAYHVVGNNIKIVILFGFRSMEEMERYFHSIQECLNDVEIVESFSFSNSSILKRDECGLLKHALMHHDSLSKI